MALVTDATETEISRTLWVYMSCEGLFTNY